MKNRRLTIFFVVMTLAISPQVWQKFGNLLDAIQRQAQVKMLSLVLSPQDGQAESETLSPIMQPAGFSPCHGSTLTHNSLLAQAQVWSQIGTVLSAHKNGADERAAVRPGKHEAPALDFQDQDMRGETLAHVNEFVRETPKLWSVRDATFLPTNAALDNGNIAEYIVLPKLDVVAPMFVENMNVQLKLKKVLDENRLTRQKTRCPLARSVPPLPAS